MQGTAPPADRTDALKGKAQPSTGKPPGTFSFPRLSVPMDRPQARGRYALAPAAYRKEVLPDQFFLGALHLVQRT